MIKQSSLFVVGLGFVCCFFFLYSTRITYVGNYLKISS